MRPPEMVDLMTPLDLAEYASEGAYRRARHLQLIQQEVMAVLYGPWDVLVAQAPPRHGKSQYISRWLSAWLQSVYPASRSILTSYSVDLARTHSRWVRDRVHQLAPLYGHGGVRAAVSAATDWETTSGGGMLAAGVGGGITGRGADKVFVIDDALKNAEQAISRGVRESQWEWFQTTAFTRLEKGAKLLCLATRWHQEDLLGMILKAGSTDMGLRIREVRLPALAEPTEGTPDPLGRQTGEALWPEQYDVAALTKIKNTLEPYWWDALYQQRLGSYGKNEWPAEYFWGIMAQDDEWPTEFALSATALDPSKGKDARKGDYSAIVTVGYSAGKLWIDADLQRRPVPQMVGDLVQWNLQRRPTVTGIEANAFQDLLAESYVAAQQEHGYYDPPELITNNVAKELRIARLGFWLRAHMLKVRNTPGGRMLVQQMQDFPNGAHDDGPDCLEVAIRILLRLSDALQEVASTAYGGEVLSA